MAKKSIIKIYIISQNDTSISADDTSFCEQLLAIMQEKGVAKREHDPLAADFLLLRENEQYKNFHYLKVLINDSFISRFINKVLTINTDDYGTGIFNGLYTSIPKKRFDAKRQRIVPYYKFPNPYVFNVPDTVVQPQYLASWRGNTKSHKMRSKLASGVIQNSRIKIETTDKWYNHDQEEQADYVALILNSKFSLCPPGWANVSFRIYESMALGRAPVILTEQFEPPVGPDWNSFALIIPERSLHSLEDRLLASECAYQQMGERAKEAWDKFFSGNKVIYFYVNSLIELLQNPVVESLEEAVKRLRSWQFYYQNKWTVLQRTQNRVLRGYEVLNQRLANSLN